MFHEKKGPKKYRNKFIKKIRRNQRKKKYYCLLLLVVLPLLLWASLQLSTLAGYTISHLRSLPQLRDAKCFWEYLLFSTKPTSGCTQLYPGYLGTPASFIIIIIENSRSCCWSWNWLLHGFRVTRSYQKKPTNTLCFLPFSTSPAPS